MRISEPLPRLTPDLRAERHPASGECSSQGSGERWAESYYLGLDDSIFGATGDYVLQPLRFFAPVCGSLTLLERYLGFLYFCWTNPSDIPIFGNTGWWIMFRPLGRPLILLPDQRNRFAICPRLPQQQRHEIWEYVTSWGWDPSFRSN